MVPGGGMAEAKVVTRRARPSLVVVRGATALDVGVDAAQAEAEEKRVSSVFIVRRIGCRRSSRDENNLSSFNPTPLMVVPLF